MIGHHAQLADAHPGARRPALRGLLLLDLAAIGLPSPSAPASANPHVGAERAVDVAGPDEIPDAPRVVLHLIDLLAALPQTGGVGEEQVLRHALADRHTCRGVGGAV